MFPITLDPFYVLTVPPSLELFSTLLSTFYLFYFRYKFISFSFFTDESVSIFRGQPGTLTCPIDVTSCGELHSVKWFKGNERIAVLSGSGEVANVEGEFVGR